MNRLTSLVVSRSFRRHHSGSAASIDATEVSHFNELSEEWHDEKGPFKALHSLNQLRVPWILNNVSPDRSKLSVVDVGCGGGLLSLPLARSGLLVTGIDASSASIKRAQAVIKGDIVQRSGIANRINFKETSVEDFGKENVGAFDVVIASEILEHVADLDSFIAACTSLAKPGANLFFTTINRTQLSKVLAIWMAEEVLRIVPRGVHDWNKFVRPEELDDILRKSNCHMRAVSGLAYNPLVNRWSWTSCNAVNYVVIARKNLNK